MDIWTYNLHMPPWMQHLTLISENASVPHVLQTVQSAAVIKPLSLAEDAEHKLPQACFSKTP